MRLPYSKLYWTPDGIEVGIDTSEAEQKAVAAGWSPTPPGVTPAPEPVPEAPAVIGSSKASKKK